MSRYFTDNVLITKRRGITHLPAVAGCELTTRQFNWQYEPVIVSPFPGLDPEYRPKALGENSNEVKQARFAWAGKFIYSLPGVMVKHRLNWLLTALRKVGLRLLTRRSRKFVVPEGFRAEMLAYYRDDIARLQAITGRDLSNWSS